MIGYHIAAFVIEIVHAAMFTQFCLDPRAPVLIWRDGTSAAAAGMLSRLIRGMPELAGWDANDRAGTACTPPCIPGPWKDAASDTSHNGNGGRCD